VRVAQIPVQLIWLQKKIFPKYDLLKRGGVVTLSRFPLITPIFKRSNDRLTACGTQRTPPGSAATIANQNSSSII